MRTNSANCRMFPDRDLAERGGLRSPPGWGRFFCDRKMKEAAQLSGPSLFVVFVETELGRY